MKNRTSKEFKQLRIKIFLRTVGLLLIAAVATYSAYSFLRHAVTGFMLSLFQGVFGMEEEAAASFYNRTFRRHRDVILLLSMTTAAFALFHIYLRSFTRYFDQISKGLDNLLQDTPVEISLPQELLFIERKMNLIGHTIDRQKSDMMLAEQRKNDMIMYLAHDLKTPLASSISYLNLLLDEKQISDKLREKYLSISLSKAQRLEDLINEFLEIAKYNLSHITLQYSQINLTRLLEQLVFEFQPVLEQKNLVCKLDMADNLLLKCDADKMQRVFDNLLRNAVLYSYEGSEITIMVRSGEDGMELQFTNHGDTIPQEKLERIFEQFYRLDAGRSTEGSGLGLAIAKQIVTLHKGTITAASRQEITVFTVTLPV